MTFSNYNLSADNGVYLCFDEYFGSCILINTYIEYSI